MNVMKLAIWTTTVVGLTPATLFSMLILASNVSLARQMKTGAGFEHDDGGDAYFTYSYLQVGKTLRLEVTTAIWPSICLMVGAGACVVGLLFLIPRQTQYMKTGGFDKIEQHVENLMQSRSKYTYLVISRKDDEYMGVSLSKGASGHSLDFSLTTTEQSSSLVAFFFERGLEAVEDYVVNEDTESEYRHMSYSIGGNATDVAAVCASLLTDVYGIREGEELMFCFGK